MSDGSRRVTSISEITGMEGETITTMQEIFMYERTGVDKQGQVIGRFRPTGIRPRFAEKLKGLRFAIATCVLRGASKRT